MACRHRALVLVFVAAVVVFSLLAATQSTNAPEIPRTPWGAPDLQGIWDFRTITPIHRPEELGDKAFFTVEEAASLE